MPYPAEGGEDASGAGDAEERDGDGAEALGRGGSGEIVAVICCCGGVGAWWRVWALDGGAEVEEGGGACDEDDAEEGDHAGYLFDAGEGFAK